MVSAIEKQLLQSQVMERIQQVQQQHPDMQQQYFKIQFGRDRQMLKKKVNQSGHIDHTTIDAGEEKKQQKDHPRDQGAAEQAVEEKTTGEPKPHDHIDIKV